MVSSLIINLGVFFCRSFVAFFGGLIFVTRRIDKPPTSSNPTTNRLNTCIGRRNYVAFFLLVQAGMYQMALQTAVVVALLVHWNGSDIVKDVIESAFGAVNEPIAAFQVRAKDYKMGLVRLVMCA